MSIKSQLYLHKQLSDLLKSEIESFQKIYNSKLFPIFDNIEEEAENESETYYQESLETIFNPNIDPADIAEKAFERGIDTYQELSLIKYEFTASAISTSFMLWEQQVRRFLFNEVRHYFKIEIEKFCTNLDEIKKVFEYHGINLEDLDCWDKIHELQLLYNVIKHGDGRSAKDLKIINSNLFNEIYTRKDFPATIESSLLSEVLMVDQSLFNEYCEKLKYFWELLPERSYGPELE